MKEKNLIELTNEIFISMLPSLYGCKLENEDSMSFNKEFMKCFSFAKSAAIFLLDDKKEKEPISSEISSNFTTQLSAEYKVQLMLMKELLFHGYETCKEGLLVCYVFDYFNKHQLEWCDSNFSMLIEIMISKADTPDNPITHIINSGCDSTLNGLLSLYYQLNRHSFLGENFKLIKEDSIQKVKHLVYDCHYAFLNNKLKIVQSKLRDEDINKNKDKILSLMKDLQEYQNKRNELSKFLARDILL